MTLVVHNYSLDVWQGVGQAQGRPAGRRVIVVTGDRVHVRVPGDPSEVATYRWRISSETLTLELVDHTPKSPAGLAGLRFVRAGD